MQKQFTYSDRLRSSLRDLDEGDTLRIPLRFHNVASIKVTASQLRRSEGLTFAIDSTTDRMATLITRKA